MTVPLPEGVERLQAPEVVDVITFAIRLNEGMLAEVRAGSTPASAMGGTYHFVVFGHLALLAGHLQLARRFVALSTTPEARKTGTKFWNGYAGTLAKLLGLGEPEDAVPEKLRGGEKHWVTYVRWMESATSGDDPAVVLQELAESFARRNRDKRVQDDAYGVEGSGLQPVSWDFRLESLLKLGEVLKGGAEEQEVAEGD